MITEKQKQVLEMQDKAEDIEQELFRTEKSLSYAEVAHIVQYVFKLESDQVRDAIQALADFRRKEPTDSRLINQTRRTENVYRIKRIKFNSRFPG